MASTVAASAGAWERARRRVATFIRLPGADRLAAIRGAAAIVVVSALVHTVGLRRTVRTLDRIPLGRRPGPGPAQSVVASVTRPVVLGVERAAAVVPCRCLARSLASWWLLRRRGIAAELLIGVRPDDRHSVDAHAWLEVDGCPVNDRADVRARYSVLEGVEDRTRPNRFGP